MRNVIGAIGILAVTGLVVSALSSKGTGAATPTSHNSASAAATASAASQATAPATQLAGPGTIGSSFDVQDGSGDSYQVTLVKVIDPAESADQFVTLQKGDRLVGVVFRITGVNGSPQGEDANNDCTIIGTDGRMYTAGFDPIVGYTNFEVGVIHVAQGATVEGAVTFAMPQYVDVVQVHWAASDGLGSTVVWYPGG